MDDVWLLVPAVLLVGGFVWWALGIETINPMDGKHDDILYEMLGYPLWCRQCLAALIHADFDGIVTIRCPNYNVGSRHSYFRWKR